jgi:tetratricopeptide (TPR) repeat protein
MEPSRPPERKTKTIEVNLDDGFALQRAGRLDEAAAIYKAILKAHPKSTRGWNLLGSVSIEKGDLVAARRQFEKGIAISPRSAEVHHNLGVVLRLLGDLATSRVHLEEALRLKPGYAEAYHNYVAARRFEPGDPMAGKIETLLKDGDLDDANRCFAHFAAGKIYDDMGETNRAFDHFRAGNRLKGISYDAGADDRYFARLREVFDAALFDRFAGHGHVSDRPIFIVGMPRSGTTLAEQVLASHAQVFGAGERNDLGAIAKTMPKHAPTEAPFPDCLADIGIAIPARFGAAYLKQVGALAADDRVRLVDKNPHNFKLLGLIAVMFPNARIVHCMRSPLDTCLSCYFHNFTRGQEFSFDLGDLGHFYSLYHGLMEYWRDVLPVPVFELRYEDMVADHERVTRELLAFCGLPWDESCARFFETRRPVRTASSWQVRQPLYNSSVGRWKAYEAKLGPLIAALGPLAES